MSSAAVLAFALAMLLALVSTRWSPLLLLGLVAVYVFVPHDIYHDEWAVHWAVAKHGLLLSTSNHPAFRSMRALD